MEENRIFDKLPAKFCGMVEEYRLELAKKSGIDLQLDVSLAGITICGIHENVLISKKFGFIKRLVDNDKIDLDKLIDNTLFTMLTHCIGLGCEWKTAGEGESALKAIGTDSLIAYLSIQDNPIEFLISILK